jgi:mycothiol synthase
MSQRPRGHHLRLRPATHDDVAAITALMNAASQQWLGRATSQEQIRDRLDTPGTEITLDTVVAIDARESMVGFGHVWPHAPNEIRILARTHPDHYKLGVGFALQDRLMARATERAPGASTPCAVTSTSWPGDAASEALLAEVGYAPVRYYLRMVREIEGHDVEVAPLADGFSIRGFTTVDADAIFAAYAESFADHWGHQHVDREDWWHERRDAEAAGYDPGLWLVAYDGAELIGFVTASTQRDAAGNDFGYVGDLGVRSGWRGKGVGAALLTRSLAMFGQRGLPRAALDVDAENTTGAVRLYTKIGMQVLPSFTIWSQRLVG